MFYMRSLFIIKMQNCDTPSKRWMYYRLQSLSVEAQEIHCTAVWIKLTLKNISCHHVFYCIYYHLGLCY